MQKNLLNKTSNQATVTLSVKMLVLTSLLVPVLGISASVAHATDTKNITSTDRVTHTAKHRLMAKLGKLPYFSANFSQKILNVQGEVLQQGSGTLAISKPNLVNWTTITPDETLIISDGNTLWFYDPFIEQVSAYSLAKSIHNTPILLLTSDEPTLWQQYQVTEQEQRFIVTPNDKNSQIKRLTLSFTTADFAGEKNAQLNEFSFQDATGQISQISLSRFNSTVKPDASLFKFTLPHGVRLEDKR